MKKFSFVFLAVFLVMSIFIAVYYISNQSKAGYNELSISDAFNFSGAKMVVNELDVFARVDGKWDNLDSMTQICKEVFSELDIKEYSENTTSTDNIIREDVIGTTTNGVKVTAMASIDRDKKSVGDKYITIDLIGSNDGEALLLRGKIEKVLNKHRIKANVNSCITGTYEGNLPDNQLEKICRKILNQSDAKKVDSFRYEDSISVSAFSPMIRDKMDIGGKDVNLSLAIRYNKQENKTYLWVATPTVNEQY